MKQIPGLEKGWMTFVNWCKEKGIPHQGSNSQKLKRIPQEVNGNKVKSNLFEGTGRPVWIVNKKELDKLW